MMKIPKWIKELMIAHYDPYTRTIKNCEKGSIAWHHENRHLQQNKNVVVYRIGVFVHVLMCILSPFWLLFGLLNNIFMQCVIMVGLTSIPYVLYVFVIEIDANIYSIYKSIKF